MKTFLLTLFAVMAMIFTAPVTAEAKSLDLRVDASQSAPIFRNEAYAQVIARSAAREVLRMQAGDTVSLRSFGAVGLENLTRYEVRLSRRTNPPERVARIVAARIMRMANGGVRPQGTTEIVAMLQWGRFNCQAGDHIWIASDGIETGMVRSSQALLNGREQLPSPRAGSLTNCRVSMVGIGQTDQGSVTSRQVNTLIAAWQSFMRKAGARFTPVAIP